MGMYDVSQAPADAQLWQLIALCAGAHALRLLPSLGKSCRVCAAVCSC